MVNANEIRKLAERLAKAEQLVRDGGVFPVAGLNGCSVIRNGDGSQMYLVCYEAGKEHCTCKHFEHRQDKVNAPWKCILAAQIGAAGDAPQPTSQPERKRTKLQEWQDEDEADARAALDRPAFGNLTMPQDS